VRYDRSLTIYGAFFHIACRMIVLRRVVQELLGEIVSGPIKIGSGLQEEFCMEGRVPNTAFPSVSCLLLGGTWKADFIGSEKDVKDFFTIIRKLN
jgi:hypothetical protein